MNQKEHINSILDHLPYDIHCGRHSGFPECCIKFFITKWIWNYSRYKLHWKKLGRLRKNRPDYIPCPTCLKNKTFVKLISCPKNCKKKIKLFGKHWYKKYEK